MTPHHDPSGIEAAEQRMLGGMLGNADAVADVLQLGVTAADLSFDDHRLIFAAAVAVHAEGGFPDVVTVYERLRDAGNDAKAGGLEYLQQLHGCVIDGSDAPPAARLVLKDAARRRLVDLGHAAEHTSDVQQLLAQVQGVLSDVSRQLDPKAAGPSFPVVPFDDLDATPPAAPSYWWDGYMPAGVVTLLGAHGGAGKSTLSLMLAMHIATGRPLFGVPVRQGRVLIYSAEDGAALVRYRLWRLARALGVELASLFGVLRVIDATEGDPALYRETGDGRARAAGTTPAYAALRRLVDEHRADVVVIDNASDTHDASEIDRAKVRAFMRALTLIARPDRAVLLLAHVDKGTSRGDRGNNAEGYSGSTAWHNSARSRLFLGRDKDDALLLEHQKNNLGPRREPLRLLWPDGGIPMVDTPPAGIVGQIAERNDERALLRLIHEFATRGESVAASHTSPTNAARMLSGQRSYPQRKPAEVFDLLRDAERRGLIKREQFRGADRKPRERWALTTAGLDLIGASAATAATAATSPDDTQSAVRAGAAATAATCGAGGVGGGARTQDAAREAV